MDAIEEGDVALQRASSDLLSELQYSLPKFLFKKSAPDSKASIPRHAVRNAATAHLIKLLEPFQEWPQLLDPHLDALLTPLINTFLKCIESDTTTHVSSHQGLTDIAIPLPQAICKLLYTICKIRGSKVVSRFFANEPRYLEPMLEAFQAWTADPSSIIDAQIQDGTGTMWEVNYIFMLWLSHLLLTPFDLASLDSEYQSDKTFQPENVPLPSGLPTISSRLVYLATGSFSSAGKEREVGVTLLVRLALRPDMRRLGLHKSLIQWALSSLKTMTSGQSSRSIYKAIGLLSFIAGTIKSADILSIGPFLLRIYQNIGNLVANKTEGSKEILSSALSRKAVVKIYCAISIATIQLTSNSSSGVHIPDYVLEEVIDHLLTALADNDTPVRHAASKALSMVTAKLDRSMATEILEAVIGCLDENVLWDDVGPIDDEITDHGMIPLVKEQERNLTAVNSLKWQGLILTLSHLLFRRSPPVSLLPEILNSLILALGFEQRSSSGNSIGANVRDAACFGIWSLARRYTTAELLAVDTKLIRTAESMDRSISILQILATELVITATTDPSGNIRRGSSAALQELIGRHPDTIVHGISLVQTVDYHAVALRSRALHQVAISAAMLDQLYWQQVLFGLLSWRGIGAIDAESRRQAANAVGSLCQGQGVRNVAKIVDILCLKLQGLQAREIEKRHGLLLAAAAVVRETTIEANTADLIARIWDILKLSSFLTESDFTSPFLRPEMTAEAVCSLIFALASASCGKESPQKCLNSSTINGCVSYLELSLRRHERIVIISASQAAKVIFDLLNQAVREELLNEWIGRCLSHKTSVEIRTSGYIAALGGVYRSKSIRKVEQERIIQAILSNLATTKSIEIKVEALKSLSQGILSSGVMNSPIALVLQTCLEDYTTDQRGDVGSLVRLEALDAVRAAWRSGSLRHQTKEAQGLIPAVCVLAAEKLDKVRHCAWGCLSELYGTFYPALCELHSISSSSALDFIASNSNEKTELASAETFVDIGQTSSQAYFLHLLSFFALDSLRAPLLRGLVTSIGVGSESVLRASRAALSLYLEAADKDTLVAVCQCFENLLRENLTNERLIVPTLESIAFVLDTNILSRRLQDKDFKWHNIFLLVQKAHYKTGNVHKLTSAIEIYGGLGILPATRREVLKKLASMLLHPFPKIRNLAADVLFLLTQDSTLTGVDFSRQPKDIKNVVVEFQRGLG